MAKGVKGRGAPTSGFVQAMIEIGCQTEVGQGMREDIVQEDVDKTCTSGEKVGKALLKTRDEEEMQGNGESEGILLQKDKGVMDATKES